MPGSAQELTGGGIGTRPSGAEWGHGVRGGSADQKMGFGGNLEGRRRVSWAMVEEYGIDLTMTVRGVP